MSLSRGIKCKACNASLDETDDPELCRECMAVVYSYNKKLIEDQDDVEFDIILREEQESYDV